MTDIPTPAPGNSLSQRELFVTQWQTGLRIRHMAHNMCYSRYSSRNRLIGLTATVLSALVSTAVIVSFSKSGNISLQVCAGAFSILATLFAAANTFLKYGELATKHEQAAAAFGALRRGLELSESWDGELTKDVMTDIMNKWDQLEKTAPDIPTRVYDAAEESVTGKKIR